MKKYNRFVRIIVEWKIDRNEQTKWLKKLSNISMIPGIESICLDDEELHIEYDPAIHSMDSINAELKAAGFHALHLYMEPATGIRS